MLCARYHYTELNYYSANNLENLLVTQPKLPLEKLVSGVVKLLQEPDFSTKREIIKTVITKIVATPAEINVWGFVPLVPESEVGLNVKHRYRRSPKRRQIDAF